MKFLHSAAIWMAVALMVLPQLTCAENDLEPTVLARQCQLAPLGSFSWHECALYFFDACSGGSAGGGSGGGNGDNSNGQEV